MSHSFNIWYDLIRPVIFKLVGNKYGCCEQLKNCSKCCAKNNWVDWKKENENEKISARG